MPKSFGELEVCVQRSSLSRGAVCVCGRGSVLPLRGETDALGVV